MSNEAKTGSTVSQGKGEWPWIRQQICQEQKGRRMLDLEPVMREKRARGGVAATWTSRQEGEVGEEAAGQGRSVLERALLRSSLRSQSRLSYGPTLAGGHHVTAHAPPFPPPAHPSLFLVHFTSHLAHRLLRARA